MLLKIGDFSRLSHVSIKTLRYYDEIGLLSPSQVDQFTNYRYYAIEQLAQIHRIMALKDLGLSLEQIRQMLDTELSREQLQGMFTLREAQLRQQVYATKARLTQVQFRLRMLKMEEEMPTIDIKVIEVKPVDGLTARDKIRVNPETLKLGNGTEEYAGRGRMFMDTIARYKLEFNTPISILYNFDPKADFWDAKT